MTFGTWTKFLLRHRLAIGPRGWHVVAGVTPISLGNSVAALMQQAIYGRRIAATKVHPPIFIIGHWRTGTTLLHELLVQDDRFTFPTTYECLAPKQVVGYRADCHTVFQVLCFPLGGRWTTWRRAGTIRKKMNSHYAIWALARLMRRMAFPND